jgi:hypothetical protein
MTTGSDGQKFQTPIAHLFSAIYHPWKFGDSIFHCFFITHKLFVVERWNQRECDQWPLTLKIGQGQSHLHSLKLRVFHNSFTSWDTYSAFYVLQSRYQRIILHWRKMWTLTFYGVIRFFVKNIVSVSSRKQLMLHAWKLIYNKILISWRHCAFVLRVQWTLRELLPLKLYNFYIKIHNS